MSGQNANSRGRARGGAAARVGSTDVMPLARFAAAAATQVGRWLARERQRRRSIGARAKAAGDPVTDLDVAAEQLLRERVARRWPQHGFLGEETGASEAGRSHLWIVDPIDGTANFIAGLAPWGVSIACLRDGEPIAGAVYAHPEGVTLHAARAHGAYAGRTRLRIPTERRRLSPDSIIGVQWLRGAQRLPFVERLLTTGTRVRVLGCTVVQLCEVVRGRLDANVQQQGKVWDVAAAGLIVQEAGGAFSGWDGRPIFPCSGRELARHHPSLAGSATTHRQVLGLLRGRPPVSRA